MKKSIGKEISLISRQFNIYITRELSDINVLPSEYIFIVNIDKNDKVNQKNLCDKLVLDKALATRALTSLVQKGFVRREKNPADKREYFISLTEKGEEIKPIIVTKLEKWTKILQGDLTDEKFDEVYKVLESFIDNALKENQKL